MNKKKTGTYANDIVDDLLNEELNLDVSSERDDSEDRTVQITSVAPQDQTDPNFDIKTVKNKPPAAPENTSQYTQVGTTSDSHASVSDKVRTSVGKFFTNNRGSQYSSPIDVGLAQSESIRIAQERILELEQKLNNLRYENEQLVVAGETLQKRADELISKYENAQAELHENKLFFEEERKILKEALGAKDKELYKMRHKYEELEAQLSANMQKIRIREKELENRLELVKMESSALIQNKNEIILDLKKNIDQLVIELESYKSRGQVLNQQIEEKQDMLRRTVRTLRIALTMLEGSKDETKEPKE